MNNIQRKLKGLNNNISSDYQKLSDKYDDLKLSHKRQEKILKLVLDWFSRFDKYCESDDGLILFKDYDYMHDFLATQEFLEHLIIHELDNPLFRCRQRSKHE